MDKRFVPAQIEAEIYNFWEKNNFFINKSGKPYTILMPPPNANASLHAGHGMYTIDDIIVRWKIINGFNALWIPGQDHAGFETQYVYEKYLAKQDKSRLDFDRQTLYNDIFKFVKNNSDLIFTQFKRLGFAAAWERNIFTLDEKVINTVFETFKTMESKGLVYRNSYMVNFCSHCGTSLAELEVVYIERKDPLYYIKYGPFTLATVRPETKFGDTAVAVHPKDKRYQKWIGREIEVEGLLGKFKMKVIGDNYVDPKFGTGVVKVTPAHDPNDFEMGKRHCLETKQVIDLNGRLTSLAGPYAGLKVKAAREKVVNDLEAKGLIEKIDENYTHSVTICYKCGRDLEPTIIPNWFIQVKELKKPVEKAVEDEKIKFHPKKYKKQMLQWLAIMHDWPISRQVVWGIRIPVWYEVDKNNSEIWAFWIDKNKKNHQGRVSDFLKQGISLQEIESGLQKIIVPSRKSQPKYVVSIKKPLGDYLPETDTFDTWFSSGQWPLVTLKEEEYKTRFPTDVLGTLSDILKLWVSRMIMFSLYVKKEVPFKNVYLWSMVTDAKGQKMSKSKGNVVNPIELVDKYGADAFRTSLLFGTATGGKVALSEDKVRGMRNFANKVWNIGRFLELNNKTETNLKFNPDSIGVKLISDLQKELKKEQKEYKRHMEAYRFSKALGVVYEFIWHRYADYYLEQLKEAFFNGKIEVLEELKKVYFANLKMLHPFMPFLTEAIWQVFHGKDSSILTVSKK